jgi:hypothetical protein
MGHREVRPVAIGWEHPRKPGIRSDGSPRYRPLFSRADLLADMRDREREIDPDDYMPPIPEGHPYGYALYETTTEGTPISPVFGSLEDLAEWCEGNATWFSDATWTRDHWLESFRAGTLDVDTTPAFINR